MVSKWVATTPYNLQSEILSVYFKALAYSTTVISDLSFIKVLSLNNHNFKVYSVQKHFNKILKNLKKFILLP